MEPTSLHNTAHPGTTGIDAETGRPTPSVIRLWTMLKRYAEAFYQLGSGMTRVRAAIDEEALSASVVHAIHAEGLKLDDATIRRVNNEVRSGVAGGLRTEILQEWAPRFRELFSDLDLAISLKELNRWENWLIANEHVSTVEIRAALDNIDHLVQHELEDRNLIYLEPRRASRYEKYRTGWELALEKFDIARDVEEAEKCFALERFTASVFHAMRIAEIGVQALGKHFNLQESSLRESWGNIVNALDGPIKKISDKEMRARWSFIVDDLCHMNFALRIPSMHPRSQLGTYTDEQAQEVLGTVRTMMRHLAEALPPVS